MSTITAVLQGQRAPKPGTQAWRELSDGERHSLRRQAARRYAEVRRTRELHAAAEAFIHGPKAAPGPEAESQQERADRMPWWPDHLRAVPNVFARSALFAATHTPGREVLVDQRIAVSMRRCSLRYTGPRLTQSTLDVYLAILHMARSGKIEHVHDGGRVSGVEVQTTCAALADTAGRRKNGQARVAVYEELQRLATARVTIDGADETQLMVLLQRPVYSDGIESWSAMPVTIVVPAGIVALFASGYTQIDSAVRSGLRRPSARWIYMYMSSHKSPDQHMQVARLARLMGLQDAARNARATIRTALQDLSRERIVSHYEAEGTACRIVLSAERDKDRTDRQAARQRMVLSRQTYPLLHDPERERARARQWADEHPERVKDLHGFISAWMARVGRPLGEQRARELVLQLGLSPRHEQQVVVVAARYCRSDVERLLIRIPQMTTTELGWRLNRMAKARNFRSLKTVK